MHMSNFTAHYIQCVNVCKIESVRKGMEKERGNFQSNKNFPLFYIPTTMGVAIGAHVPNTLKHLDFATLEQS